jgi:hypothetical protein
MKPGKMWLERHVSNMVLDGAFLEKPIHKLQRLRRLSKQHTGDIGLW